MAKKTTTARATKPTDVQKVQLLTEEQIADAQRQVEREESGKEPSLEERQAQAEQATPPKRAEFVHTDFGYEVNSVDGDQPPRKEQYHKLDGLIEHVLDMQENGFTVYLEGQDKMQQLDKGGRVYVAK